jgi:hypothetical protein
MSYTAFPVFGGAVLACILSVTQPLVGVAAAAGQSDRTVAISVDDSRPLAKAIETLERRFGWIITYEDTVYVHPSDIADVTASVRRSSVPGNPPVLVPRGGPFSFTYVLPGTTREPEPAAVLEALLDEYNLFTPAGGFRLLGSGTLYHVVGTKSRNGLGTIENFNPPLDRSIDIAAGDRDGIEMLRAIMAAASDPTTRLELGTVPVNTLMSLRVREGATREKGRAVLLRTLQSTSQRLSWQLFCGPGPKRTCSLNVHVVSHRPDGY